MLAHALIWVLVPSVLLGNLYPDTITAAYWGRDFAFGYFQHPPMTSWIIDCEIAISRFPIFSLLVTAQITTAVTALFVWKSTKLYRPDATASIAVLLYLVSPAATVFAVILNHNSMLAPFWAATMFFALRYLEHGRSRDALTLGLVAGLAMMTKYEIAFLLISIFVLALATPRFRHVFGRPASYAAAAIALLVFAPNLYWLSQNHWLALGHASGVHKVDSLSTLGTDAYKILTGLFVLYLIPALLLFWLSHFRAADRTQAPWPVHASIGAVLAFGPLMIMLLGSVPTHQIVKPLWVLPMTSSMAVGLSLLFPLQRSVGRASAWTTERSAVALSGGLALGFAGFLIVGEAVGQPAIYFVADTLPLSTAIKDVWRSRQIGSLECVAISENLFGGSAVLWLPDSPRFVNVRNPPGQSPSRSPTARDQAGSPLSPAPTSCHRFRRRAPPCEKLSRSERAGTSEEASGRSTSSTSLRRARRALPDRQAGSKRNYFLPQMKNVLSE